MQRDSATQAVSYSVCTFLLRDALYGTTQAGTTVTHVYFLLCTPAPVSSPSLNVKTARSWRGIVPFTHLAREGRMTCTIGRRGLLAALGGAAAAWPLAARSPSPIRI